MVTAVIIPVVAPPFLSKGAGRAYSKIEGREVFLRCVELYAPREKVGQRIVVVPPDDMDVMRERYSAHLGFQGVTVGGGGSDWFGCVARALEKLDEKVDTVIIHDSNCPAVPFTLLDELEAAMEKHTNAAGVVPVVPTRSGFADVDGVAIREYVEMSKVVEVQSPQIFRRAALVKAYAARGTNTYVDDAELVMSTGGKMMTIAGSRFNLRIDNDDMVRLGKDLIGHMPKPKSKTPLTPFGEAEW
jgi:2-C-methyl-D-erythritol 4-phosphate cytidylyltransferase